KPGSFFRLRTKLFSCWNPNPAKVYTTKCFFIVSFRTTEPLEKFANILAGDMASGKEGHKVIFGNSSISTCLNSIKVALGCSMYSLEAEIQRNAPKEPNKSSKVIQKPLHIGYFFSVV